MENIPQKPLEIWTEYPQPHIRASVLEMVGHADDERVIRAMDALNEGAMLVELKRCDETIIAEVTSTTTQGKRHPRTDTNTYHVAISAYGADCSCPDAQHRHTLCKHIIGATMVAQEREKEQDRFLSFADALLENP